MKLPFILDFIFAQADTSKRRHTTPDTDSTPTLIESIRNHKGALTAEQIATFLACSVKQVYKLAKRGSLPCYRIGTLVRFDPSLTAVWLETRSLSA